jgi:hypothetical protein
MRCDVLGEAQLTLDCSWSRVKSFAVATQVVVEGIDGSVAKGVGRDE